MPSSYRNQQDDRGDLYCGLHVSAQQFLFVGTLEVISGE